MTNWIPANASRTTFQTMFSGAFAFNRDISGWNTDNITNMSSMFLNASAFNSYISGWNTNNVTNMASMFDSAVGF